MGWAKNRDCEKCQEWIGQCDCTQHKYGGHEITEIIFDEASIIDEALKVHPKLIEAMQKEGAEHWVAHWPPLEESEELPF